jgi:hypothetical protein
MVNGSSMSDLVAVAMAVTLENGLAVAAISRVAVLVSVFCLPHLKSLV